MIEGTSSTPWRKIGRTALAASAAVALSAAAVAPSAAAVGDGSPTSEPAIKKLTGEVGPGFTISISKSSTPAGKYKLTVNDKGTIHNFHISGPGVDKKTSVSGTGKTTWKLNLKPGVYNIVCDPHSGSMKTTLTVT